MVRQCEVVLFVSRNASALTHEQMGVSLVQESLEVALDGVAFVLEGAGFGRDVEKVIDCFMIAEVLLFLVTHDGAH